MKTQLLITVITALGILVARRGNSAIVQSYQSTNWEYSTDNGGSWSVATAGFGGGYDGINTYWEHDTTILVKTTIDLSGYDIASASYSLGIDNDLRLYVNGTEIRDITHEGLAYPNDYSGLLTLAISGPNEITLQITDRGGLRYFDMQISATPVPEPSTYLAGLIALGILGMFGWRSRK